MLGVLVESVGICFDSRMVHGHRIQTGSAFVVGHRDQTGEFESRPHRPDSLLRSFWHCEDLRTSEQALRYSPGSPGCSGSMG